MFTWLKSLFKRRKKIRITNHIVIRYKQRIIKNKKLCPFTARNSLKTYATNLWKNKKFTYIGNCRYYHDNLVWIIKETNSEIIFITLYHAEDYHRRIVRNKLKEL